MSQSDQKAESPSKASRRKGVTSLTLGWLADRLRRAEKIKEQIASGAYQVNSAKIAESILNQEKNDQSE